MKIFFISSLLIFVYSTCRTDAITPKLNPKSVNVVLKTEIDLSKNKKHVLKNLHNIKNLITGIKRDVISRRSAGRAKNVWKFAANIDTGDAKSIRSDNTTTITTNRTVVATSTRTTKEIIEKELRGSAQYFRPYSYYIFDVYDTMAMVGVSHGDRVKEYVKAITGIIDGDMKENLTGMVGQEVLEAARSNVVKNVYIAKAKGNWCILLGPCMKVAFAHAEFDFLNRRQKHSDNFNQLMNFIDAKGTMEDIANAKEAIHHLKNKTATKPEVMRHILEEVFIRPFMKLSEPEKTFIITELKEFIPKQEIGLRHNFKHNKNTHRFDIKPNNIDSDMSLEYEKKHGKSKYRYKNNNIGKSTKALKYSKTNKPKNLNIIKKILKLFNRKGKRKHKYENDKSYRRNGLYTRHEILLDKVNNINKNNLQEILSTGKLKTSTETETSRQSSDNEIIPKDNKSKLKAYRRFDEKDFHFSDISLDAEGLADDIDYGDDDARARSPRAADDALQPLSSDQDTSFWDHADFISKEEEYLDELRETPAGFPPWLLVNLTTIAVNKTTATTTTTKNI